MDDRYVFLSYSSSKLELIEHLSRYFEKNNIRTWYARRNIPAGTDWPNEIEKAIKQCTVFILLFCSEADSSKQVKRELALADKYKKPVFWIKTENVEPVNLGYFLTSTQWIDWMDNRDDTLEQLIHDIIKVNTEAPGSGAENESKNEYHLPKDRGDRQSTWAKGVIALPNEQAAAECIARTYFSVAQTHPFSSVILPTGRSATAIFREMIKVSNEYEGCPFGDAQIMTDTETFGVWPEHDTSRTRHVNDALISKLRRLGKAPEKENLHLLTGVYTDTDPVRQAQKVLREFPPSIHAVSLSPIGEVLAYEVGVYHSIDDIVDDGPRIVEVGEHSKKYIDPNQPSRSILTIGLGTALSAEILLLVAFDIKKSNILRRMFSGPMTAGIPATILRQHPNAFIVTTSKVAENAEITEFTKNFDSPREASEWMIN